MSDNAILVSTNGRYFWETVRNFIKLEATNEYTVKKTITKSVSIKEFSRRKLSMNTGFSFNQKFGVSAKYMGTSASSETAYSYHLEVASELEQSSEHTEDIRSETVIEDKYTIKEGGSLTLYQLILEADGILYRTDVFSNVATPPIPLTMQFECKKRILGLDEVLEQFGKTRPGIANRDEWGRIRDTINTLQTEPSEEKRFKGFVECLNGVVPNKDNIDEWAKIRATCQSILGKWDSADKQLLFLQLNGIFRDTFPGSENTNEWAAIRAVCDAVAAGVKQLRL